MQGEIAFMSGEWGKPVSLMVAQPEQANPDVDSYRPDPGLTHRAGRNNFP